MADEKKPGSRPPVVVRRGHVRPPPPGARIEPPVEERLGTDLPAAPRAAAGRPLWQRLAEEKAARAAAPAAPKAPRGDRPPRALPGRRAGRGAGPGGEPEPAAPESRRLPPGVPPPAPEAPRPEEGSFEDLLASSGEAPRRRFAAGEKVAGKILQIGQDVAFLELGSGHADGLISVEELRSADGTLAFRPGDIVDGVVTRGGERGVEVSRGLARERGDLRALADHVRTGLPVEGTVRAANKGGLDVEVLGQRAFCPLSQIDLRFVADPASYVGRKLRFRVQRADARDVVLSRRALLEEERAAEAARTRERLAPGAVFEGTVTSVQDYGAFVDLGGVEGLVHVSELSWDRVSKPADVLKPGERLQVQVLRLERDARKGERISLSVRALAPRPEAEAAGEPPRREAEDRVSKASAPAPGRGFGTLGDLMREKRKK